MSRQGLDREQTLSILAATPSRLAADQPPARLQARPTPEEWSATEILAHLRSCADVWGDCIAAILAEDGPTLRAINPTTWIDRTNYRELMFGASLDAFTTQRAALLAVLEPLAPADWSRTATVTGAGKPLERTVLFYAQWLARHERSHFRQFDRLVRAKAR